MGALSGRRPRPWPADRFAVARTRRPSRGCRADGLRLAPEHDDRPEPLAGHRRHARHHRRHVAARPARHRRARGRRRSGADRDPPRAPGPEPVPGPLRLGARRDHPGRGGGCRDRRERSVAPFGQGRHPSEPAGRSGPRLPGRARTRWGRSGPLRGHRPSCSRRATSVDAIARSLHAKDVVALDAALDSSSGDPTRAGRAGRQAAPHAVPRQGRALRAGQHRQGFSASPAAMLYVATPRSSLVDRIAPGSIDTATDVLTSRTDLLDTKLLAGDGNPVTPHLADVDRAAPRHLRSQRARHRSGVGSPWALGHTGGLVAPDAAARDHRSGRRGASAGGCGRSHDRDQVVAAFWSAARHHFHGDRHRPRIGGARDDGRADPQRDGERPAHPRRHGCRQHDSASAHREHGRSTGTARWVARRRRRVCRARCMAPPSPPSAHERAMAGPGLARAGLAAGSSGGRGGCCPGGRWRRSVANRSNSGRWFEHPVAAETEQRRSQLGKSISLNPLTCANASSAARSGLHRSRFGRDFPCLGFSCLVGLRLVIVVGGFALVRGGVTEWNAGVAR